MSVFCACERTSHFSCSSVPYTGQGTLRSLLVALTAYKNSATIHDLLVNASPYIEALHTRMYPLRLNFTFPSEALRSRAHMSNSSASDSAALLAEEIAVLGSV